MAIIARPYESADDLRRMQALQQELWPLERERTQTHVGDLAWWQTMHVGREREWKRRLWLDRDRCVAWAWLRRPASLDYSVDLAHRGGTLHDEVFDWFEDEAEGDDPLRAYLMDGDEPSREVLARHGFASVADGTVFACFALDLDGAPRVDLPGGFAARAVRGTDDLHARVEVHRAAWEPSRVTEESYANLMRTWPYREDLDAVVEAPDGSFAAYALCWYDAANRVGELEPVGTHPAYRRRGLGAAACAHALAQLRAAGGEGAVVYAVTDEACGLYEALGFRRHTRVVEMRKERG